MSLCKVSIFGSCVSRDALEVDAGKTTRRMHYFARSSIASVCALPSQVGPWINNIESSFQQRMVRYDFEKTFCKTIAAVGGGVGILLVDLIDERFELYQFSNGAIVTASNELKASGFPMEPKYIIPKFSDKFFILWERGWKCFLKLLSETGTVAKLRVNKVFWASETESGKDFSPNFPPKYVCRANNFLQKLYARMADDIPGEQFFEFHPSLLIGSDSHQWGPAPYHYIPDYYKQLINHLK